MPINLPDPGNIEAWCEVVLDSDAAHAAVRNENCPPKALEIALRSHPELDSAIASNPNAPSEILERIFQSSNWYGTKNSVVGHKNATSRIFELALVDKEEAVRTALAQTTSDEGHLKVLANDSEEVVRRFVASNNSASKRVLTTLVGDKENSVIAAVIGNKQCDAELFDLAASRDLTERTLAEPILSRAYPELIDELLEKIPHPFHIFLLQNPSAPESKILKVLENAAPEGIMTFTLNLAIRILLKREKVSSQVLSKLIPHCDNNNLTEIASLSYLPPEIAEVVLQSKLIDIRLVAIANPAVPSSILIPLIKDKSKKVQAALANRTYYGKTDSGWGYLDYENRDELWQALESGAPAAAKPKKLTMKSAISTLFETNLSKSDFDAFVQAYKKGGKNEWLDAASTESQKESIAVAAYIRAAQLGHFDSSNLKNSDVTGVRYLSPDGSILKYVLDSFVADFNDVDFSILRSLNELPRVISSYFDITKLSHIQLVELMKLNDPYFNWKVATKCDLDEELLELLALSPAYRYSTYKTDLKDVTLELGEWALYSSSGYRVEAHPAAIVAFHPKTSPELLAKISKSSNKYVKGLFIENEKLFSMQALEKGLKDKSEYIRALVAAHEKTTPEMLASLALDQDPEVRAAVMYNSKATPEIKALLALNKKT